MLKTSKSSTLSLDAHTPSRWSRLVRSRTGALFALVLVVGAVLTLLTPQFLTKNNLTSVAMGMTYDLLMASGMTLV